MARLGLSFKNRTGSGSQNMTVRSSLVTVLQQWICSGLVLISRETWFLLRLFCTVFRSERCCHL